MDTSVHGCGLELVRGLREGVLPKGSWYRRTLNRCRGQRACLGWEVQVWGESSEPKVPGWGVPEPEPREGTGAFRGGVARRGSQASWALPQVCCMTAPYLTTQPQG